MDKFDEDYTLGNVNDELEVLGNFIAEALLKLSKSGPLSEYEVDNSEDYVIGELARCLTLQNLYLDREEYEKCAIMKLRIITLNKRLGLDLSDVMDDPEED